MEWLMEQGPSDDELTMPRRRIDRGDLPLGERFTHGAALAHRDALLFVGREMKSDDPVIIRVLRPRGRIPESVMAQVQQDIHRVASQLRPYVMRVYACGWWDDQLVVVTEPRGDSLADLLATRRLGLDEALGFGRHITSALAYMQTHHVTHGLLTPAAIDLLSADQGPAASQPGAATARITEIAMVRLVPFVLDALPADGGQRPSYRAPEERRGAVPDCASDIYHLGALLWELSLGTPPPMTAPHLARAQLAALPLDLQEMILSCLQPDPAQRPAHLDGMLANLRAIQRVIQGKAPTQVVARYRAAVRAAAMPTEQLSIARPLPPSITETRTVPAIAVPHFADPRPSSDADRFGQSRIGQDRTDRRDLAGRWRHLAPPRRILVLAMTAVALCALAIGMIGWSGLRETVAAPLPAANQGIVLHAGITTIAMRPDPYLAKQTLVIGEGQTLRIEPGVTLRFAAGAVLDLRGGVLEARGTDKAPITLTGPEKAGTWGGIHMANGKNGVTSRVVLEHVAIRFAGVAGAAAVHCEAGAIQISASAQSDSLGDGIRTGKDCWGEVALTTFERDSQKAADIASPTLKFHDNTVQGLTVSVP